MRDYKISEEFAAHKDAILDIPNQFNDIGEIVQNNRNVIKKITGDMGTVIVKNFLGMYFFNRLGYSLFRRSKASRSYIFSGILKDRGITTPQRVAWINYYSFGLLMRSYYISVNLPDPTLHTVLENWDARDTTLKAKLYHDLAAFTIQLHKLGIYHKDYSLGNILVKQTDKGFDFSLVDLNRILFKKVSFGEGIKNFSTLGLTKEDMNNLVEEYATQSNQPKQESVERYWRYLKRKTFFWKLRKGIRRYTLTPLEQLMKN